ncbi:MAG: sulfur oxidation c-type cytochrome SoxX, partial [Gammaproteobacteria bacterium]|nr:sulfur oxidation c-type cytochrome SoxX [Gammaproteobacteria bacterium]NIU04901.1 sulfur oxidation c-type cytochrome SoxX [Gammaproteobacteria bacterium]NIX86175.1 sulfur oxidation c-type cytochrome SoxX [Gammaproteobacteria bacterium]
MHRKSFYVVLAPLVALAFGAFVSSGAGAGSLVNYEIVDGEKIETSLTGKPGDPENGRKVAINRKQGNCLACHKMPVPEQPFHGNVGPPLTGVGSRLTPAEVRLRIVNPKVLNPDTIMPAFYRSDNLHRVMKKFQGTTILTPQQ